MKRATKKKPAPAEPLRHPPIAMHVDEPAGPATSPWTQRFLEATAPMSPEKTEVVRLAIDAHLADECCNHLWQGVRECRKEENFIELAMYEKKRRQDLVPKARTKAELAERAADEQQLAECRARRDDFGHEWTLMMHRRADAREKALWAKIAKG